MAKNQGPLVEGLEPLANELDSSKELDSSVNVEVLKNTEHLKQGQIHSVSYAIALIFIKQGIAKIVE